MSYVQYSPSEVFCSVLRGSHGKRLTSECGLIDCSRYADTSRDEQMFHDRSFDSYTLLWKQKDIALCPGGPSPQARELGLEFPPLVILDPTALVAGEPGIVCTPGEKKPRRSSCIRVFNSYEGPEQSNLPTVAQSVSDGSCAY